MPKKRKNAKPAKKKLKHRKGPSARQLREQRDREMMEYYERQGEARAVWGMYSFTVRARNHVNERAEFGRSLSGHLSRSERERSLEEFDEKKRKESSGGFYIG